MCARANHEACTLPPPPFLVFLSCSAHTRRAQAGRGMLSNAKKCLKTHTCNSILHVCNTLLPHVGAVEVESITLHWRAPASACARNVVHTPCVISDLLRARTYTHTRTLYTHATYTHSACTPAGLIDFELFGEARCKYVVTA